MTEFEKVFANVPKVSLDELNKGDKEFFAEMKEKEYNGKISLRVPATLHYDLVYDAKKEGISLNQYIMYCLTKMSSQAHLRKS